MHKKKAKIQSIEICESKNVKFQIWTHKAHPPKKRKLLCCLFLFPFFFVFLDRNPIQFFHHIYIALSSGKKKKRKKNERTNERRADRTTPCPRTTKESKPAKKRETEGKHPRLKPPRLHLEEETTRIETNSSRPCHRVTLTREERSANPVHRIFPTYIP